MARFKDELVDLSLAEIDPLEEKKAACRESINRLPGIADFARLADEMPGPGELKNQIEAIAAPLRKASRALAEAHEKTREIIFNGLPVAVAPIDVHFVEDLDRLILICDFYIDRTLVPSGGPRRSHVKNLCAVYARSLFRDFSQRTGDRLFFKIAPYLYEIVSGKREKDLDSYCEGLDDFKPLYVVRIPPNVKD